jgi:multiple sugar transport system permease protein
MYGFVNYILSTILQIPIDIDWFSHPFWSQVMIVSADFWQWMPFIFIALYAALSTIPTAPLESAVVDGASSLQIFRYIQLPQLKGIIAATVLLRAMDAFKIFDYILLTTAGGPGYFTESLSYFIYRVVFKITDLGYSSAASVIYLWIATVFIILFFRVMRERMV